MLNDTERAAVKQWYEEADILSHAKALINKMDYIELEEYLHMTCLFPLSRHSQLPAYLKKDDDQALFPHNFNPKNNLEAWQDAIEIGWSVIQEKFNLSHDEVHQHVAREQKDDWDAFMKSVEERKKARGLK